MNAMPPPNAVVKIGPKSIRASFSEPLVVAFSKLSVATSKGVPVFGKVTVSPADPRTLVDTFARPLPAGDYEVSWKSVTADTHMMQGVYSLHVAP